MARMRFSEDPERRLRLAPPELFGILAFWAVLAVITAAGRRIDPRIPGIDPGVTSAFVSLSFIEYTMWALLTAPIIWLASRFSIEGGRRVARVAMFIALGLLVAASVDYVLSFFRGSLLPGPRPEPVWAGAWRVTRFEFLDDFLVYLAILGTGIARDYFLRYRIRVDETVQLQSHAAQLRAQLAQAELSALRSQLNPHFLFNTLHAVSSLVERDPKGVRRMIARLSELLRSTLEGSHEQETSVDSELVMLQRYLDIMEIRYQGRLEVDMSVEPEVREALVPSLILQPIVENAMKHGVDESSGDARIAIHVHRDGDQVVLRVTDSGAGPALTSAPSNGVGLRNTEARLEQLYGRRASFALATAPGGGATAEVRVPYHTAPDSVAPTAGSTG